MTNEVKPDTLHEVKEAARRFGLKESTVRRMIYEKKIDVFRPSPRSVRISEATIRAILARGYRPAEPAR